jgi:2-oxoglutarate ferredoxin oxidoreductase subunit alpha
MQESLSELTMAEVPLVVFNMARSQGDYFQATRGGGHGDYRHLVLAPQDVREGIELVQLAFHLADKWRNPVMIYGDYLLAHTQEAVSVARIEFPPLPAKDWAVDGTRSGSGRSMSVTSLGVGKPGQRNYGQEGKAQYIATKMPLMEREARVEVGMVDDAETIVVAFGSPAKFVKYAIHQLREEGLKVGYVRPITLWPFPYDALRDAASGARVVGSFEISSGQMVDDVRIGVGGQTPVEFIGGVSSDHSGFGLGRLLDVDEVRERIRALHEGRPQPAVPGYPEFTYELAPHQLEVTP